MARPDGVRETLVGIADHELDASEYALFERANELTPKRLALLRWKALS